MCVAHYMIKSDSVRILRIVARFHFMHDDENNGQGFQDHDNYCIYANHAAKESAAHPKVVSGLPISYKERATIANGRSRKSVYNVPHISQFLCFDSSYFISQIRHFCVCVCLVFLLCRPVI